VWVVPRKFLAGEYPGDKELSLRGTNFSHVQKQSSLGQQPTGRRAVYLEQRGNQPVYCNFD
jgi:hypothetical protein